MGRERRRRIDRDEIRVSVVPVSAKKYLQLRWVDPDTGEVCQRSSGTKRRRDAERIAVQLEHDLVSGTENADRITWEAFRKRFESEHLAFLSPGSRGVFSAASAHLESMVKFRRPSDLTTSRLSTWKKKMLEAGMPKTTVTSYMKSISACLGWGAEMRLIREAPAIKLPKKGRGRKLMRSRPITAEEFDRILNAAEKVRPKDFLHWQRFIKGLWHSGFRVGELCRLSWDANASVSVDTSHKLPLVKILADGQKSEVDQWQPITKAFWDLLCETPEEGRKGLCFQIPGRYRKQTVTVKPTRIREVVAEIGKASGVVTDEVKRKTATSHDIGKRAFANRAATVLTQTELATYMRHASIETTAEYYLAPGAVALGERGWDL